MSSQNLSHVDDPYSIRKCQIHPKNMSKKINLSYLLYFD